ncbi:MAG TPA: cytochrome c biogenesis protein CcsA [Gammaproteobacteria bacterium]|nr:cytochrome c biogenesis protein CcsA [Gammaproteobacteria bacterium]
MSTTPYILPEVPWLWAGLGAYAIATYTAFRGIRMTASTAGAAVNRSYEHVVLMMLVVGVILLATALTVRWERLGHGPFVNLFELLMSQLFSLGLVYTIVYWRIPVIRPSAVVGLSLLWILGLWELLLRPTDSVLPPTYYNKWLWVHVGVGKVFLSLCLIGTGLAGVILLRSRPRFAHWFRHMPSNVIVDNLAWRFMLLAFVFHSLMLIAGAAWAQDAWGRYWAWDALETSSFLTWLALGMALHARFSYRIPMRAGAITIVVVFVLAFLTYFGAPFYSQAAHKGVV